MGKSKIFELGKDGLQKLLDESASYAEVLEKLGMSMHGHNYKTLNKYISEFNINLDKINENRKKYNSEQLNKARIAVPLEDIITGKYKEKYKGTNLKDRLIKFKYKETKCERCGLTEWLGNPIPLQLHHIDGDHYNNLLENLQVLCPNCHVLTDNFGAKNIKNKKRNNKKITNQKITNQKEICPICNTNYKSKHAEMCRDCFVESKMPDIDRDTLKSEIRTLPFLAIGKKYNVTDNAIRKWCKKFGLPFRKCDINNISDIDWINV